MRFWLKFLEYVVNGLCIVAMCLLLYVVLAEYVSRW